MFYSEFIFRHVGAGATEAAFEVHDYEYAQHSAEDSRLASLGSPVRFRPQVLLGSY